MQKKQILTTNIIPQIDHSPLRPGNQQSFEDNVKPVVVPVMNFGEHFTDVWKAIAPAASFIFIWPHDEDGLVDVDINYIPYDLGRTALFNPGLSFREL